MTSVPLNLLFIGPSYGVGQQNQMYTRFTDQTYFTWDPTQPISNSAWSGRFMDPVRALPTTYLNVQVMNNSNTYTWAWPSMTGQTLSTFSVPTGNVTLQTMMNNIYNASRANITTEQYEDIVGQPPEDSSNCTVANALSTNATNMQYTLTFQGLVQEPGNVLRILC